MRCLLLLLSLGTAMLRAQQLPFIPVTGANAPSGVRKIFEDRHGGLWLAGNGAADVLRYFDGLRFITPYEGSFPNVLINGMAEDGEGGIWLATTGGLYRLLEGRIQQFMGDSATAITPIASDLFLAAITRTNNSPQTMLVRIAKKQAIWNIAPITTLRPGGHAEIDDHGNVLYPCDDGFCEVRGEKVEHWRSGQILHVTRHKMAQAQQASVVVRDRQGCIWAGNDPHTVYQCPGDKSPTILPYEIARGGLQIIAQRPDGSMVIPTVGVMAIGRPGKFELATIANGYPSFGDCLVTRDNNIWLGSAAGLWVLSSRWRMEYWAEREGVGGNPWSILPLGNKTFAIAGNNVEVLSEDRSRWLSLIRLAEGTHLIEGPDRTVLISSKTQGVIQMSVAGKILRRSEPSFVNMLARTPDGQVWSSGAKLARLQLTKDRIMLKAETAEDPRHNGMDMKLDGDGSLWSCYEGGLIHRTLAGWQLLPRGGVPLRTSCNAFAFDKSGAIWFGTTSNQFELIQNRQTVKPLIQDLTRADALGGSHFLEADGQGRLWRGTSDGLFVADPEQARRGEWLKLSRADGFPGIDTNQHSFLSDRDGSVWFGIDNAVIHLFPPDDLVHPAYAPTSFISGFSWNSDAFHSAENLNGIAYGSNITAHIGSLQMDRRNSLHFRYRLLPQQTSWRPEPRVDIQLGNLPWGMHTLEVQSSLGSGPWSSSALTSFQILRPFWLSSTAMLGFAFAGTLTFGLGYSWQKKRRTRALMTLPGLAQWRASALSGDFQSLESTVLGLRFEVRRMIARGGFATVWEARDRQHQDRSCAVKVFRRELIDNAWMTRRFQQEVSALERIHHPNVVRILGHGTVSSGAPYLAMEFIEGETLREKLRNTRLANHETASYLRQIAAALAEIHAQGICHRDVKPENLMIRSNAAPGTELVLIDFSIAIVQDPDETIHGLSRAAGTLYYMAPEQAIGYANESSDIYSLAKILIEMLTGERLSTLLPDASIDLPARVRELLMKLGVGLSPASVDLLASALEFDPSHRPSKAGNFGLRIAEDLEGYG